MTGEPPKINDAMRDAAWEIVAKDEDTYAFIWIMQSLNDAYWRHRMGAETDPLEIGFRFALVTMAGALTWRGLQHGWRFVRRVRVTLQPANASPRASEKPSTGVVP